MHLKSNCNCSKLIKYFKVATNVGEPYGQFIIYVQASSRESAVKKVREYHSEQFLFVTGKPVETLLLKAVEVLEKDVHDSFEFLV